MSEKNFIWTDEEITLLLNIANDYKTGKTAEGVDWLSIKNRYQDLTDKFCENYPKNATKEFPKGGDCTKHFTRDRVSNKLKRIKSGYKKAIDSGRRSGGGRVVTTFYQECSELWGGCPTVECTKNGVESCRQQEVEIEEQEIVTQAHDPASSTLDDDDLLEENDMNNDDGRRSLLKFLHDKRDSKLSKKVATDTQLVAIANEELALKRKVAEKMEQSEKKYQKTMDSFASGITALTTTINSGFTMLGNLLNQGNKGYTTPSHRGHGGLYAFNQPQNFTQFDIIDNYGNILNHPVSPSED